MSALGPGVRLRVREVRLAERAHRLRIPFRFGQITLTEASQAFVRVRVEAPGGKSAWGIAAELLVPKWFDKRAERDDARNVEDLRHSVRLAADACQRDERSSAFALSMQTLEDVRSAPSARGLSALSLRYGPALIDRAVLDGLCRLIGCSVFELMAANGAGFDASTVCDDLPAFDSAAFLRTLTPRSSVYARHTVGLIDPLTADEVTLDDGLPVSLDQVIETYGVRYFKLKLAGDVACDVARLSAIAAVLERQRADAFWLTLDGNEQFEHVDDVIALLDAMSSAPRLNALLARTLWLEQPLSRARALACDVRAIAARLPVIIDESDDDVTSLPRAVALGYAGVSSKQCKGLYKSLLNAARIARWRRECTRERFVLSGEDLSCQAGPSVQQDLALAALLGIDHVERNGHHFGGGLPAGAESERFLRAHPGLYRTVGGRAVLAIRDGQLDLGSLFVEGFALGAEPQWQSMHAFGSSE